MAPHEQLAKRACPSGYRSDGYGGCYYSSPWNWWGRWVFAGVVLLFIVLLLFCVARRNTRRRRQQGIAPLRGTGWLAPAPPYYPPPPVYSQEPVNPQGTGQKFNANEGYYGQNQYGQNQYGNNQEGIQLQPPAHAYQPPQNVYPRNDEYAAPEGPPPPKR